MTPRTESKYSSEKSYRNEKMDSLGDKLKNKRNIINCISRDETSEERPTSVPEKKVHSNTDRSGKEKSD